MTCIVEMALGKCECRSASVEVKNRAPIRHSKFEIQNSHRSAFRIRHSTFAPFVLEQLLQQLGGDVPVLEAAHFGEELVAQDADVRLGQSGGGEDVDHLAFGGDGLAHELADGGVDLLGRLAVLAALFVQRSLQGLEKGNVVANFRRFIAGGAEGKGAGKFRDDLVTGIPEIEGARRVLPAEPCGKTPGRLWPPHHATEWLPQNFARDRRAAGKCAR